MQRHMGTCGSRALERVLGHVHQHQHQLTALSALNQWDVRGFGTDAVAGVCTVGEKAVREIEGQAKVGQEAVVKVEEGRLWLNEGRRGRTCLGYV